MKKKSVNRFGKEDKQLASDSSSTRLYEDDYVEVQALCAGGRKESEMIRELVRSALFSRRYKQAMKDPAFRELLRAFDDQIGVRIHLLEERLTQRLEADFLTQADMVGYIFVAVNFMIDQIRGVSLNMAPESVSEEEFLAGWTKRRDVIKEQSWAAVNKRMAARNQKLAGTRKGAESEDGSGEGENIDDSP